MIGISELILIIVLGVILFKPEDYGKILKTIIQTIRKIQSFIYKTKSMILDDKLKEDIEEIRDQIVSINGKKYIYGDDDKLHEIFDLNDLKPK